MKNYTTIALVLFGFALNGQNAATPLSYRIKNNTTQPVTCMLTFKAYGPQRRITMQDWKETIAPGQSKHIRHDYLDNMNLIIQDSAGDIIADQIVPAANTVISVFPDNTVRIAK